MLLGFLVQTKMKAYTNMTVVMRCPICDRRSLAPSFGDFRRRLQVSARVEAGGGGVAALLKVKCLGTHVRHARIGVGQSMAQ